MPRASEPCNSSRSTNAGEPSSPDASLVSRCMTTCEPSPPRLEAPRSSSEAPRASVPASPLPSTVDAQARRYGPKCSASASGWRSNGLSWSSPPATRLGKPKSRQIWRELATTVPEWSLRLAILVRRISAGECSFLPTPVSRDSRSPGKLSHPRLTGTRGQPLPEILGARVHPEVCEWLMGLPVGWTEMLPSRQLEIPTHREWQQSSGGQS